MRPENNVYFDFYFGGRFVRRFHSYKTALKFAILTDKKWTVKEVKKRKLSTRQESNKQKEFDKCQD